MARIVKTEKNVEIWTPYNSEFVNEIKAISGRRYDPAYKMWTVPLSEYDKANRIFNKYFPQVTIPEGGYKISRGEGYGGSPYVVGSVLRDRDGNIVKVVSTSSRYYREDGMSFGVGDESGHIYIATVVPATEEEAKPLLESDAKGKNKKQASLQVDSLRKRIKEYGEMPSGDNSPEGKRYFDKQTIYGGGDWFVIGNDYIWYAQNNGADGDDWSRNNVRTGGAGAIGWRVPYNEELANEVKELQRIRDNPKPVEAFPKEWRPGEEPAPTTPAKERTKGGDKDLEKILQDEENDKVAHKMTPEQEKADDERDELGKLNLLNIISGAAEEIQRNKKGATPAPKPPFTPEQIQSNIDKVKKGEPVEKPAKSELRAMNQARSSRSRKTDKARAAKKIISPNDPRVHRWMKAPGTMDILRVDTPKGVKNPTLFRPRNPKIGRPTVESNVRSRKVGKIYVSRVKGDSGTMYSRKPVGRRRKKR